MADHSRRPGPDSDDSGRRHTHADLRDLTHYVGSQVEVNITNSRPNRLPRRARPLLLPSSTCVKYYGMILKAQGTNLKLLPIEAAASLVLSAERALELRSLQRGPEPGKYLPMRFHIHIPVLH